MCICVTSNEEGTRMHRTWVIQSEITIITAKMPIAGSAYWRQQLAADGGIAQQ
jgi:hypothetical protein